jgi:hypothetical protein
MDVLAHRQPVLSRVQTKGSGVVGELSPFLGVALLLAYPAYILLMAGVLRLLGVPKTDIAKWALKQAERQRLADLVRAARGLPDGVRSEPPADAPSG